MIYYSIYIFTYIYIYTYIYILVWLDTPSKKYMSLLKIRRNNTIFQIDPCFFAKVMHVSSHWVQSQPQVFDESSGGQSATPEQSTLNPQDCRTNWWIQRCWIVFMKNLFTNQTYYVYVVFSKNTFSSYDLGKLFWDTYPKSHIDRMIQRSRNFWAYQHFWSPALAHFLLDPSRTLKVQQVIYWIWKWRVEYYSKLDISSYPFLLISNELWPTAQVLLFLQDGLNLLQVSLAWYRWSLWDADWWPRVVQKNHVFTMESKVRSAEVTYPPEV